MKCFCKRKALKDNELKDIDSRKNDKCMLCGCETGYILNTPVSKRSYYVVGCGQMCEKCYKEIYKDREYNWQLVNFSRKEELNEKQTNYCGFCHFF